MRQPSKSPSIFWGDVILMPAHHRIFSRFRAFYGQVPAYCQPDFLGTMRRLQFVKDIHCSPVPTLQQIGPPEFDEEYFEWIDLLESVAAARGSYTMLDLGAGHGRWAVRAAFAVRQYWGLLPHHLIAVEAEPTVFGWMPLHFRDNGIDPALHTLIHAAVTPTPGDVLFYIGGPRGGPFDRTPDNWYGQSVAKDYDLAGRSEPDGTYCGAPVLRHESGWRSIRVPSVTLAGLLQDLGRVDLIDMDIEGQELPVIRSTIHALDKQVKRLHIGTHGKEIEDELRRLLFAHEWSCWADYSLFSKGETPWGTISFENGVQGWVNPRLSMSRSADLPTVARHPGT